MSGYRGPYTNVKLEDGRELSVQGTYKEVVGTFRSDELCELTDVYGRRVLINPMKTVWVEQAPGEIELD